MPQGFSLGWDVAPRWGAGFLAGMFLPVGERSGGSPGKSYVKPFSAQPSDAEADRETPGSLESNALCHSLAFAPIPPVLLYSGCETQHRGVNGCPHRSPPAAAPRARADRSGFLASPLLTTGRARLCGCPAVARCFG